MKKIFNHMSLRFKLVALVIGISVFSILTMSLLSSKLLNTALTDSSNLQIESVGGLLSQNMQETFLKANRFAEKLSKDRLIEGLFLAYEGAFYGAAFFPGEDLKIDTEGYQKLEETYHSRFFSLVKGFQFENVLLASKDGQVILSGKKDPKADYLGRHIPTGSLAKTPIKKCFDEAMKLPVGKPHFTGFFQGPYGVSSFFCVKQNAEFDHLSEGIKAGELMGVIIAEFSHETINQMASLGDVLGDTAQAYLLGEDNLLRSDLRLDKEFSIKKSFSENTGYNNIDIKEFKLDKAVIASGENRFGNYVTRYVKTFSALNKTYALVIEKEEKEILAPIRTINKFAFIGGFLTFLIAAFIGYWVARQLAVKIMKDNESLKDITNAINSASKVSLGDSEQLKSSSEEMAAAIHQSSASMHELTQIIQKTLESVSDSEEYSKKSSDAVRDGLTEIKNLSESINEIENTNKSIFQDFTKMNQDLQKIKDVINKISEKTDVINDIVFQTKLLSFNASVEAARAGEHGKGFAVVAEEIGSLATGSGKAALEITSIVSEGTTEVESIVKNIACIVEKASETSESRVAKGVQATHACEAQFKAITECVKTVGNNIAEISAAGGEQKIGVQEIGTAMDNLNIAAQTTAEIAKKSNASAIEMLNKSETLSEVEKSLSDLVNGDKKAALKDTSAEVIDLAKDIKRSKKAS